MSVCEKGPGDVSGEVHEVHVYEESAKLLHSGCVNLAEDSVISEEIYQGV